MKGLEPSTFCMASRRSSQLSYIREERTIAAAGAARTRSAATGRRSLFDGCKAVQRSTGSRTGSTSSSKMTRKSTIALRRFSVRSLRRLRRSRAPCRARAGSAAPRSGARPTSRRSACRGRRSDSRGRRGRRGRSGRPRGPRAPGRRRRAARPAPSPRCTARGPPSESGWMSISSCAPRGRAVPLRRAPRARLVTVRSYSGPNRSRSPDDRRERDIDIASAPITTTPATIARITHPVVLMPALLGVKQHLRGYPGRDRANATGATGSVNRRTQRSPPRLPRAAACARLTALTTARSDAVTIDGWIPTPQTPPRRRRPRRRRPRSRPRPPTSRARGSRARRPRCPKRCSSAWTSAAIGPLPSPSISSSSPSIEHAGREPVAVLARSSACTRRARTGARHVEVVLARTPPSARPPVSSPPRASVIACTFWAKSTWSPRGRSRWCSVSIR